MSNMYYITNDKGRLYYMASIIKKKVKKYTYYYLVESARVNGKPRIVSQIYLGTADNIAKAVKAKSEGGEIPVPEYSIVLEFGAVCALYDLSSRLGVIDMIDKYASKRNQGLSVGEYMVLAAINRAVEPESKNEFSKWFDKTVLHKYFPAANKTSLSSQGFWENMSLLDDDAIKAFEDEFTKLVVSKYELKTECLIYDTTNFYTYIDTNAKGKLAKRGNSKEKRKDLKIVGLSMMVSPDYNIPLFHEVYPGSSNDAKQFSSVAGRLKERYMRMCGEPDNITLVFDKGNNSPDNLKTLREGDIKFKVVSSLRLNQCGELLDIRKESYTQLKGSNFNGVSAYRTQMDIYGDRMTIVITHNPELLSGQLHGISNNILKCEEALNGLGKSLEDRLEGKVKRGRKPTVETVTGRVQSILSAEYMSDIFDYEVTEENGTIRLKYGINDVKFDYVKEHHLGKTVIYTDNHGWETEKIVTSYRSQYHIEDAFKQMKNTDFLSFRPLYHWTDQKIKVHAFYCVLALRLCCLLNREISGMGFDITTNKMLKELSGVNQVITVFPSGKKATKRYSLSGNGSEGEKMIEKLGLKKYQIVV